MLAYTTTITMVQSPARNMHALKPGRFFRGKLFGITLTTTYSKAT